MPAERRTGGKAFTRRLVGHPIVHKGALILVLLLAVVLPRVLALRGVPMASRLSFADMPLHLINLDKLEKLHRLERAQLEDPFFTMAPHHRSLFASQRWPWGTYQVGRTWSGIFGPLSIWTTQLTHLLFTLVLVAGVFGLGAAMASWRAGWWAALLTALSPPLVASTFYFNLDYPLVAMTVMALLLLWHTRGLTSPWVSLLFGVWCALSISVKPAFALYLFFPVLWALVCGLRGWPSKPDEEPNHASLLSRLGASRWPSGSAASSWPRWAAVGANALLVLVVALLLIWWLYSPEPRTIATETSNHFSPPGDAQEFPAADIEPWTADWVLALPKFAAMSFPWPLLLLAIPGFVLLHRSKWRSPPRMLLLSTLWGGYLVLTLMANKLDRYVHPLYPLLCLLTVWGVIGLIPRRWQTAILTWIAVTYAAVLYIAHIHPPPWGQSYLSFSTGRTSSELDMPSRRQLAGLRRNTYHPTCRLAPLVDGLGQLARRDPSRRPLGVALVTDRAMHRLPLDFERLTVWTAQVVRDRLVFPLDIERDALSPSVVVVHSPGADPRKLCPQARQVAQLSVRVACETETELRLSLLQPRELGMRCNR